MATGARELLRSLGESLLAVLRAEVEALRGDYRRSAGLLGAALALLAAAAAFGFWAVGALALSAFELLARWLPRWGAAAALFGLLALIAVALGTLGLRRLRRIEPPLATASRHLDDHLRWWQDRVFERPQELPPVAEAGGIGTEGEKT